MIRGGRAEGKSYSVKKPGSSWVYLNLVKLIFYAIRQKAKIDIIIKFRWR